MKKALATNLGMLTNDIESWKGWQMGRQAQCAYATSNPEVMIIVNPANPSLSQLKGMQRWPLLQSLVVDRLLP